MMIRKFRPRARRGVALVEAAILYPVFLLLLLGILVMTLGMFRYGQLSSLTWEAARWASVRGLDHQNHGPDYTREQTLLPPSKAEIVERIDPRILFGFNPDPSKADATIDPGLTTVALDYVWKPEYNPTVDDEYDESGEPRRLFAKEGIPLRGASTMPTLRFRTD